MASHLQGPDQPSPQTFRPAKRRRFYRKRTDAEDDDASDGPSFPKVATPQLQTVDELISHNGSVRSHGNNAEGEHPLSVADLIRQRKAILRRRGGIEFTNLNPSISASNIAEPDDALIAREDDTPSDIKSVIERFTPQTGQVSETTDKHMYVRPSLRPQATRRSD